MYKIVHNEMITMHKKLKQQIFFGNLQEMFKKPKNCIIK